MLLLLWTLQMKNCPSFSLSSSRTIKAMKQPKLEIFILGIRIAELKVPRMHGDNWYRISPSPLNDVVCFQGEGGPVWHMMMMMINPISFLPRACALPNLLSTNGQTETDFVDHDVCLIWPFYYFNYVTTTNFSLIFYPPLFFSFFFLN